MRYKKALSFLLSASLALSPAAPVYAFDVDSGGNTEISADTLEKTQEKTEELTSDTCEVPRTNTYSGTCGANLTWALDDSGTLTISGTGAMTNYWSYSSNAPWYSYRSNINSLIITDGVTSIGSCAFEYCSSLTSITIGDGVTSIGDEAFYDCSSLAKVYITDIAKWCEVYFYDYYSNPLYNGADLYVNGELLTNLVIPDSVTSIGNYAFMGCSSLTSVTIPDSVTSIGSSAFRDCSSLAKVYITDIAQWCEIDFGNSGSNPLCNGAKLYVNGEVVTDIVIPAGTTEIGSYLFYGYSSLASVTIPDSVTSIGDCAFDLCESLTSVTIGDSVTSIGWGAFYECSSLTSITIPDSVTSIGSSAFSDCSSLTSVTIGDSVTSIGSYAFSGCSSLTSVTIPDSVTSIGDNAFYNCSSLTSVTIGDSVTSIGDNAFYNCSSLAKVYITDIAKWCEIDFGDSNSNPLYYGAKLYVNGELLTNLVIPDSVTSIGNYAFYYCSSLTSVTIPDSVTSIGYDTFRGCSSLAKVYITDIAKWCEIDSYYGSNPLCNGANLYVNGELLTNLVIPDSVTSIGDYAFYNCSTLTSITIPDSVTSIGSYAFQDCSSLTSVTIGDSVTSISYNAFYGCSSLESVYITSIESWCNISFYNSSSNPFNCAEKLYLNGELVTELVLPADITTVDSYAFQYIECIKSLVIPDGVAVIQSNVFYGCSGIETVTLPKSLVKINENAFYGCSSIKKVYYAGSESEWNEVAIASGNDYLTNAQIVYGVITDGGNSGGNEDNSHGSCIASGTLGTGEWVLFEDGTVIINGTGALRFTDIPFYKYRDTITSVKISDGITSIPEDTFYKCDKIKTVIIPQSLTSIGDSAFWRCTSIKEVYYKGTEAEWESITISEYNDDLTNAVITYNYSEKTEVGIKFLARPQKTVYTYGESLSLDGAVVVKTYSDGSFTEIEDYEVSGYDSNKFGTQFVVITHGDHSFEYKVTVEPKKAQTVTSPVEAGTTVEEFSSPYAAIYEVFVFDAERKTILDKDDIVKTGCVVQFIRNGEVVDSIAIVVGGDITGDGIINAKDLLRLKKQLSEGCMVARGEYADINRDGVVTEADVDALMQMM